MPAVIHRGSHLALGLVLETGLVETGLELVLWWMDTRPCKLQRTYHMQHLRPQRMPLRRRSAIHPGSRKVKAMAMGLVGSVGLEGWAGLAVVVAAKVEGAAVGAAESPESRPSH